MAKLQVGTACSFGRPENWTYTPDDRQEKIELINGVVVQDCGHVSDGDTFSCSATFSSTDFTTLMRYWTNRTKVTVVDESGASHSNMRVIVKSYAYVDRFPSYVKADLEFWQV